MWPQRTTRDEARQPRNSQGLLTWRAMCFGLACGKPLGAWGPSASQRLLRQRVFYCLVVRVARMGASLRACETAKALGRYLLPGFCLLGSTCGKP